jgi:hypothetical protein
LRLRGHCAVVGVIVILKLLFAAQNTRGKKGENQRDPVFSYGKQPISILDPHVAMLLPPEAKPVRSGTSAYRINDKLGGDDER